MTEDAIDNVSDHLPIVITMSLACAVTKSPYNPSCISAAWHKANPEQILAYQSDMEHSLNNLISHEIQTSKEINDLASSITEQMHTSATKNIPQSKFNKHTKPYWNDHIKQQHYNMRQARYCWLAEGRPRGKNNAPYRAYKEAKRIFRAAQRKASDEYLNKTYRDLDEAADLDIRLFWKLIKNKRKGLNLYVRN